MLQSPAPAQPSRAPKTPGSSNARCMCTMDWCQEHLAPRIYKVGDLPSLGSVGIKTVPDEHKGTLRKMLTSVLCKDVSAGEIDDFVDNRTTTWNKKRIGKWHFDDAMLKRVQGGGLGFDFDSKTKPFPIKAWQHVQQLVIEATPKPAARAEKRSHEKIEQAFGEDSSPVKLMKNLSENAEKASAESDRLREKLHAAEKYANDMVKLAEEQEKQVEAMRLAAECAGADAAALEAAIEILKAKSDAWLSHDKLMTSDIIRKRCKDLTFFPTPEAHAAFFDLVNYSGAADNLTFYRPDSAQRSDKPRKIKQHTRISARRVIAQDQFLMVSVILITGLPFALVGAMFGGVSVATVSRIFCTWINFLYIFLHSEFPRPTRAQIIKAMPPKFVHVFNTDKVREIIDCTEIQMEKASEPMAARCCWSEYKHGYTAKFLAGVTPCGAFSFASDAYGGRISDPQIVESSGWLELIEELDVILADKGFLIDEILSTKFATCVAPPKKYNKTKDSEKPLTADENAETSRIANMRIHVERAFGRMKLRCKYWNRILPITSVDLVGRCFYVTCMMMNYKPKLVGSDFGDIGN